VYQVESCGAAPNPEKIPFVLSRAINGIVPETFRDGANEIGTMHNFQCPELFLFGVVDGIESIEIKSFFLFELYSNVQG